MRILRTSGQGPFINVPAAESDDQCGQSAEDRNGCVLPKIHKKANYVNKWRAVYSESCKYGSGASVGKPNLAIGQGV